MFYYRIVNVIFNFAKTLVFPTNIKNYQFISPRNIEVKVIQYVIRPEFCNNEQ